MKVKLKFIKGNILKVKRNSSGILTHIVLYPNSGILNEKYVSLRFFDEEALRYIFSMYPLELSKLEKELL